MRVAALWILLPALSSAVSCIDDPCGPGLTYDEAAFLCRTDAEDAQVPPSSGDAEVEDASTSSVSIDAGIGACSTSWFGWACADSDECGCDAPFCAVQGGQGICTAVDCLDDPSGCPMGFECRDLRGLAPSPESLCVPSS